VAPDGKVLPCTYWTDSHLTIVDLEHRGEEIILSEEFQAARMIPTACQDCPCQGGCAGRRALLGALDQPDPFCPFARGDKVSIGWQPASAEDLPKAGSACTTIVSAR
jgi:radical SAM protein with 4Fe4S-binding SPASM domain